VPKRPRGKKKGGPGPTVIGLSVFGTGVVVYFTVPSAQDMVNDWVAGVGDWFEDFNDSSREFFESVGDKFVSKKDDDPWLLDLATMKYPDNIPTLVLDLDKVILSLKHDSKAGWQVVKRPFADQFFKEISHYYEVVIFSDDVFPVALEVVTKWNIPVTGVLHRDFCKKKRSTYVKDLSKLGRNMDRVLCIDHDPEAFQLQPENGIVIREFTGDPNDSELAVLIDFLKAAASNTSAGADIRKEVQKFGGGDEDIGRRFLVYKDEQDQLVEKRRSFGRAFSQKSGFPTQGGQRSLSQFPR